jgi:hypothetical protein
VLCQRAFYVAPDPLDHCKLSQARDGNLHRQKAFDRFCEPEKLLRRFDPTRRLIGDWVEVRDPDRWCQPRSNVSSLDHVRHTTSSPPTSSAGPIIVC